MGKIKSLEEMKIEMYEKRLAHCNECLEKDPTNSILITEKYALINSINAVETAIRHASRGKRAELGYEV